MSEIPEEWLELNINESVKVKLTEAGRMTLRLDHNDLNKATGGMLGPHASPAADAEGYSSFQLWDLMARLGPSCQMGAEPPFEMTIRIARSRLRPAPSPPVTLED